jgi:hypothetical protein
VTTALLLSVAQKFGVEPGAALQAMGFESVYSPKQLKKILTRSYFVVYHVHGIGKYMGLDGSGGTGAQWRAEAKILANSLLDPDSSASRAAILLAAKKKNKEGDTSTVKQSAHHKKVATLHALQTMILGLPDDEVAEFLEWLYLGLPQI